MAGQGACGRGGHPDAAAERAWRPARAGPADGQLLADVPDAGDGQPTYGLLVSLYRRAAPEP